MMSSTGCEGNNSMYTTAVDSAIDAAVSVRDTLQALQVIEYRQRLVTERLVTLSHAYSEMYRVAARNLTAALVAATNPSAVGQPSSCGGGGGVAPASGAANNGHSGADSSAPAAVSPHITDVDVFDPNASSTSVGGVSTSSIFGNTIDAAPIVASVTAAFGPLMSAAAVVGTAANGGVVASSSSHKASAAAANSHNNGSDAATNAVVGPIAQQLAEMRAAIKAMETELEVLATTRTELVGALVVA